MTIDRYDRDTLLALLYTARPHIENQHKALCDIINIRDYMQQQALELSKKKRHISGTAVAITLPIMIFIVPFFIFLLIHNLLPEAQITFILPVSLLIVFILILSILAIEELIYHLVYKSAEKEYNSNLQIAEQNVINATHFIFNNTLQHQELQIIPFDYQMPTILNTVYGYLKNFRASNWQEAINLYEHEKQLQQINNSIRQNMYLSQQLMKQEILLLESIKSDINFNALATAGLIFLK